LLITDSLLGLPLPDFWVWFMDWENLKNLMCVYL
jgi:hypothetical protein